MTEAFDSTENATRTHLYHLKRVNNMDIFMIPGSKKCIFNDAELISESVSIGCVDNPIAHSKVVETPKGYKPSKDVMRLFK
jgi:hypothetical protein